MMMFLKKSFKDFDKLRGEENSASSNWLLANIQSNLTGYAALLAIQGVAMLAFFLVLHGGVGPRGPQRKAL